MVRRSKRWRGVRDDKEQLELVEFQPGTIYKHYYTLDDADPGMMMETNIATKEVSLVVLRFDPIYTLLCRKFAKQRNNVGETKLIWMEYDRFCFCFIQFELIFC